MDENLKNKRENSRTAKIVCTIYHLICEKQQHLKNLTHMARLEGNIYKIKRKTSLQSENP